MLKKEKVDNRLSSAITWLRFPLIFLIIMLHCYSVQRLGGNHEMFFKAVYPFYNWLGETGVPGFFFISGYVFFLSKKTYTQKLSTRIHTLFIPYLLWNTVLLTIYLAAYAIGFPQNINGKSLADYGLIDYVRLYWDRGSYDNGNFVPLLCPLWYIRNLLIISLLSPLLLFIIKYIREVYILIIALWWMWTYHNAFIPQTILFFSIGAYFSIHDINPLQFVLERKKIFLSLFTIFAIGDVFTHTIYGTPINLQIHRLALIINLPTLLLLADYCNKNHLLTHPILTNAAFIVFCVHYPIVVALRKICISQFSNATDTVHIILYFICITLSTILSLCVYLLLNQYFPKLKNLLSGNR